MRGLSSPRPEPSTTSPCSHPPPDGEPLGRRGHGCFMVRWRRARWQPRRRGPDPFLISRSPSFGTPRQCRGGSLSSVAVRTGRRRRQSSCLPHWLSARGRSKRRSIEPPGFSARSMQPKPMRQVSPAKACSSPSSIPAWISPIRNSPDEFRTCRNLLSPTCRPASMSDLGKGFGHGTHVSGIVGAARDGKVMHGVAYNATILPLQALGAER